MAEPVRIGLVGCGRIAERGYLPAFARTRGVRLTAVADPDAERRARIGGGRPAFADAEALIASRAVEAIVFASPASGRLPDVSAAARAALPTLIEKPPATDAAEAHGLTELRPAPWVAFNRRFEPRLAALRAEVRRAGLVHLRLELRYRRASWRPHVVADDALLDLGPHMVDLARWLSGGEVRGARALQVGARQAELELRLEGATARVSCASNRPYRECVEAWTGDGRRISWRAGGVLAALPARIAALAGGHHLVDSLAGQLEAFGRAARGLPAGNLATAADGAAAMRAIEVACRDAVDLRAA
jgi:predicted dehydrogenase